MKTYNTILLSCVLSLLLYTPAIAEDLESLCQEEQNLVDEQTEAFEQSSEQLLAGKQNIEAQIQQTRLEISSRNQNYTQRVANMDWVIRVLEFRAGIFDRYCPYYSFFCTYSSRFKSSAEKIKQRKESLTQEHESLLEDLNGTIELLQNRIDSLDEEIEPLRELLDEAVKDLEECLANPDSPAPFIATFDNTGLTNLYPHGSSFQDGGLRFTATTLVESSYNQDGILIEDHQQWGLSNISGRALYANNVGALIDKENTVFEKITLDYWYGGGSITVGVNGVTEVIEDISQLDGVTIDGVAIKFTTNSTDNAWVKYGKLTFISRDSLIQNITIAGQETLFDNIEAYPLTPDALPPIWMY